MDAAMVAQVRRFNRTVTQRVGALQERFLGRGRPLGAARVLWEIGPSGQDVRALRGRLGLDSGYLSRLLRSLEADALVTVDADPSDRRVRVARLTPAGVAEQDVLDRRSDDVATALLAPLTPRQRDRLVAAMADVERLLRAGTVEIVEIDPAHPDGRYCLQSYFAELDGRFDSGFDAARSNPASDADLRPPSGLLLVARLDARPVGCGALHFVAPGTCEIKRMWVAADARGMGLGQRLLGELERRAAAGGARTVRLETNKALVEAIGLYRSAGYTEVAAFNDEPYAHHWFTKELTPSRGR
jgi:DNA-binding MarR family transcriptional regulator/predicted N-acetyltransferase YhbS